MENNNTAQTEQEVDLLQYLQVLLRYWWFILPFGLAGGAALLLITYYLPPRYRAECRFEIFENKVIQLSDQVQNDEFRGRSFNPLNRHIVLLKGDSINKAIEGKLLKEYPEYKEIKLKPFKIDASPVPGAENAMLDITVETYNEKAALEYLTALLANYEQMRINEGQKEIKSTRAALQKENATIDEKIATLQDLIREFKEKNNFIFLTTKAEFDKKYIAELLEKSNQKQFELDILKSQINHLEANKNDQDAVFSQVIDTIVSMSREKAGASGATKSSLETDVIEWKSRQVQIHSINAKIKIKGKKYKKAHPKIKEILDELEVVKVEQAVFTQNILSTIKGRIVTLKAEKDRYINRADQIEDSFGNNAGLLSQLDDYLAKLEALNELKNKVHSKLIAISGDQSDKYFTRMIREPFMHESAVWPSKIKFAALGFLLFIFLSSAYVILRFYSKAKRYDFGKIIRELQIPCVATIPRFPAGKIKKNKLFLNEMPKGSVLAESYRSLRLNLEKNVKGKLIQLTSFGPGEGKTVTSLNLALCCSWTDKKVLLIDADFRRATMRKNFPEAPRAGLLDYLKNETSSIEDFVVKNAAAKLDYLPAGESEEYVTELIDGKRMEELMHTLRQDYDLVIFDTAPAVRIVDTCHLAEMTDATVIVMRSGITMSNEVAATVNRLPKEKVAGFVINDFKASDVKFTGNNAESNSNYGYSYAYQNYQAKY